MAADPHALVAPYALHALNDEEGLSFEQHLAACELCREELARLREAAASLAYGAAGPTPPPELKERILAQARGERGNVASLPGRRGNWTAPLAAAAAIAASVAIGLGVWGATRSGEGDALSTVLSRPGAKLVPLGGRGAVAVAPNGDAALAINVPPAPSGKTYEAWVIRGDKARSAGVFRGRDGTTVVEIDRRVPRGSVIAVTLERAGGVDRPTQKPLAATETVS
jgi:anti-sigma-K factor RskA